MYVFQLVQDAESPGNDGDDKEIDVDILKSDASLHVQKLGENEIGIVGIENSEQHEFKVDICLLYIDQSDHLDEKVELVYMFFDKHNIELTKNAEDKQFHIVQTVSIKLKSSLNDLILYFRNIFSLPIDLASHENNIKGRYRFRIEYIRVDEENISLSNIK